MSTLFLIGNGFDVNCGMKTKYRDVYKGYVMEDSQTENLRKFKRDISANIENWGDFEMAMAEYAEKLKSEKEFLECIRDCSGYMENYLLDELNLFKEKLNDEQIQSAVINEMGLSLSSFYNDISHNVDAVMRSRAANYIGVLKAISFNYTDSFDFLFKTFLKQYGIEDVEIIHVHGELGDAPVFGVDNVEQIKGRFVLSNKGKRGFVKPFFNQAYDERRVRLARKMINDADTICVFGMSLGDSDLSWRNEIIQWLEKGVTNHLFVYEYALSQRTYKTVSERMDIEDDEKERLLNEWGISTDSSIAERIHIPCGKNIFNIGNVIEKKEEEINITRKQSLDKKIQQAKQYVDKQLQDSMVTV